MAQEAEKHAAEDKQKREKADARNRADTLVYTTEKAIRDAGEKLDAAVKSELEVKVKAVKDLLDSEDATALNKATDDLSSSLSKIGESMYKSAGSSSSNEQPGSGPDQTKEGEFTEDSGESK